MKMNNSYHNYVHYFGYTKFKQLKTKVENNSNQNEDVKIIRYKVPYLNGIVFFLQHLKTGDNCFINLVKYV